MFLNAQSFFTHIHNFTEYWQKLVTDCQNINLPCIWYFLNVHFFPINTLFLCKQAKFVTNFWNVNYSHKWYFLNRCLFIFIYLFTKIHFFLNWKLTKFAIFHHKLSKYKLSSWLIFINARFFCINTLLFCQKLTKFVNTYREAIRRRVKNARMEGNMKI